MDETAPGMAGILVALAGAAAAVACFLRAFLVEPEGAFQQAVQELRYVEFGIAMLVCAGGFLAWRIERAIRLGTFPDAYTAATKSCPECAGVVREAACTCRWCGHTFGKPVVRTGFAATAEGAPGLAGRATAVASGLSRAP